jgi:hypothetical protein
VRYALAAVCLFLAACAVAPTPTAEPSSPPNRTIAPTPTPVPTVPPVGALDGNGIPVTMHGEPVHRGADLEATIAASADAAPFLAGGWFHEDAPTRYCSIYLGDFEVGPCPGLALFRDRTDAEPLYLANSGEQFLQVQVAATRAVVLVVHPHDPRCGANDKECPHRAIAESVAWLGDAPIGSPPPRPTGSPPPNGITREDAIRIAIGVAEAHTTPLAVRVAVGGPYWAVLPIWGSSSNQWVWVVVLDGQFVTPCVAPCSDEGDSELIVLDYVTGDVVGSMVPAGPPENLP